MARKEPNYQPVSAGWEDAEAADAGHDRAPAPRQWLDAARCKDILLLLLSVAVVFLSIAQFRDSQRPAVVGAAAGEDKPAQNSMLHPSLDQELWVPGHRITAYSYDTIDEMDKVEANWEALNPYIGIVAVDQQWALDQGLPAADRLQSDPSKGVYTLEAYHSLHCLTIVRRTIFQLARGQKLTAPFGHSMHCFDALRQHIMCNADETLLSTVKGTSAGDGQPRKCRSWGALRSWAAEHYSCYYDDNAGIAMENQTGCTERKAIGDGMIMLDEEL